MPREIPTQSIQYHCITKTGKFQEYNPEH